MLYDQFDPEGSILRFSDEVLRRVKTGKGMTFSDAILSLSEENEIEIELAAKLLTPEVRDLYMEEAQELHLVKPQPRLAFV